MEITSRAAFKETSPHPDWEYPYIGMTGVGLIVLFSERAIGVVLVGSALDKSRPVGF